MDTGNSNNSCIYWPKYKEEELFFVNKFTNSDTMGLYYMYMIWDTWDPKSELSFTEG